MKAKTILALGTIAMLVSCGDSKQPTKFKSFELSYSNGKDTINVIDCYGRKQGIWLTNTGKDTIVYLNDTAYPVQGTTAHELIKSLNQKRK